MRIAFHDESASSALLLVPRSAVPELRDGEYVRLIYGSGEDLILPVSLTDTQPTPTAGHLISVTKYVFELYKMKLKHEVFLDTAPSSIPEGDYVEIVVRDQYVGRPSMWSLKRHLSRSYVFRGMKIDYAGCVRGSVKECMQDGLRVASVYVSENTKIIFRSESAKFFVLIQVSKELWDCDSDGYFYLERLTRKFLPELFKKWKEHNCNHIVSIVLFARVFCQTQSESRAPEDYYEVVVDFETKSDWSNISPLIARQVQNFRRKILQPTSHCFLETRSLSNSAEGNMLEATNLALNIFDKHFVDRDLIKTGLAINLITPGNGLFDVTREISTLTKQRMIDNGIFLNCICLGAVPFFASPIFRFPNPRRGKRSRLDTIFSSPHWIDCQFYDSKEGVHSDSCYTYVSEPLFLEEFDFQMSYLEMDTLNIDEYDASVFRESRDTRADNVRQNGHTMSLSETSRHHQDSIFSRNGSFSLSASSLSPSMLQPTSQRSSPSNFQVINPSNPAQNFYKESSYRSRWTYANTHSHNPLVQSRNFDWKSLLSPPSLPIETDYGLTPENFSTDYTEINYTIDMNEGCLSRGLSIDRLILEIVSQRLAQGFQLVSEHTKVPYRFLLSMSHIYHKIERLDDFNILIKQFIPTYNKKINSIDYSCKVSPKHSIEFQDCAFKFHNSNPLSFNWNYMDHLISGYEEELIEQIKFWRTRFILIPTDTPSKSFILTQPNEQLDEEELKVAGFFKFIEVFESAILSERGLEKRKYHPNSRLQIQLTTFTHSSYIMHEVEDTENPELGRRRGSSTTNEDLTVHTDLSVIATRMQSPLTGLSIKDRRWHWRVYQKVFVGTDFVDWMLKFFSDIETREEAVEFGNILQEKGVIEHISKSHGFLDGYYYYRMGPEFSVKPEKTGWFKTRAKSEKGFDKKQQKSVIMSRKIAIDVDPTKRSCRLEWAELHYDAIHNPKLCYHFQLHWIVISARLLDDLIQKWARRAAQCGFCLVEAPVDQMGEISNCNPFQSPIKIFLAAAPPSAADVNLKLQGKIQIPETYFEEEFLKLQGFVLDMEKGAPFLNNDRVSYSFKKTPFKYTQYVHRTGVSFVQVCDSDGSFLWVNNRLLNARLKNSNVDQIHSSFREACGNTENLKALWSSLLANLSSRTGIDNLLDNLPSFSKDIDREGEDLSSSGRSSSTASNLEQQGLAEALNEAITGGTERLK